MTTIRERAAAAVFLALWLCCAARAVEAALPIETWRTATGARVLFVATRDLPIVDISVEFPAGASRDPARKAGLARLTLQLMQAGAGTMSESDIANRLADVGAALSPSADTDRAGYALRSLSAAQMLEPGLSVLEAVLAAPTFDAAILERERGRTIAGLREALTRPGTIAEREFLRRVYGTHPYASAAYSDPESIGAITRDDIVDFHRRHYVAERAVVAIIGDLSRVEAQRIANRLSASLPRSRASLAPLPPVPRLARANETYIAHPASQAHLRIGAPGMRRGDPDYFALWLGNQILGGGGLTSRLTAELREKRGLVYSVYSYFAPYSLEGPFVVGAQTQRAQAAEALAAMRSTLNRFVEEGPTDAELEAAKRNLVDGFVLRVDSNAKILEYLALIGYYDLPLDYIERFPREIQKVTTRQVRDAFRRRIDPKAMVTVIVGPAPQS
jgi:zinc protease